MDARDAIIQADDILTGGQNFCDIWKGFAARGLGEDASVIGKTPWGGGIRSNVSLTSNERVCELAQSMIRGSLLLRLARSDRVLRVACLHLEHYSYGYMYYEGIHYICKIYGQSELFCCSVRFGVKANESDKVCTKHAGLARLAVKSEA